jgi:hypothetical protein
MGRVQLLHDITPTTDHDYVSAWYAAVFIGETELWDEVGSRCAGATDVVACDAAVEESRSILSQHLTATSADAVTRYTTHDEIVGFTGEVDTAGEALLVVWHAGYNIGCEDISRGAVRERVDGWEVVATRMTADCDPVETTTYLLHVSRSGELTELHSEVTSSTPGVCVGRRPLGLEASERTASPSKVGAFFAEIAHLEASAVVAFRVVSHELHAHGAPVALVRAARDAADDEVRHAAAMGRIARRFGAEPAEVRVEPRPVRSLYQIALDNACEGCVRETFGALVGTHQAVAATDTEIATALADIARDETRHAALSWSIAEWIEGRLTEEERAEIRTARARAVVELRAEMACAPDPELVRAAGLPSAPAAVALVDQMARDLWS